jgi:O-antigen/teichoic acid export membrane protein
MAKSTRAIYGAGAFFTSRVLSAASGAMVVVIMSRAISVEDFGLFSLGFAICSIGVAISDTGLNPLLIRESIQSPESEVPLVRWAVGIRFLAGFIIAISAFAVLLSTVKGREQQVSLLLLLLTIPLLASSILVNMLNRRLLLGRVALINTMQTISWFGGVAFCAAHSHGVVSYSVAYQISILISVVWTIVLVRQYFNVHERLRLTFRQATRKLASALPLGFVGAAAVLYAKLGVIVLFWMRGAEESAQFSIGTRLLDNLVLFPMTLALVFDPLFNIAVRESKKGGSVEVLRQWLRIGFTSSLCVGALLLVYADWIIHTLFGNKYADAVLPLRIMSITYVLISIGYVLSPALVAVYRVRVQVYAAVGALIACFPLYAGLVQLWDAVGAAVASVLVETIVVCVVLLGLHDKLGPLLPRARGALGLVAIPAAAWIPSLFAPGILGFAISTLFLVAIAASADLLRVDDFRLRIPKST